MWNDATLLFFCRGQNIPYDSSRTLVPHKSYARPIQVRRLYYLSRTLVLLLSNGYKVNGVFQFY